MKRFRSSLIAGLIVVLLGATASWLFIKGSTQSKPTLKIGIPVDPKDAASPRMTQFYVDLMALIYGDAFELSCYFEAPKDHNIAFLQGQRPILIGATANDSKPKTDVAVFIHRVQALTTTEHSKNFIDTKTPSHKLHFAVLDAPFFKELKASNLIEFTYFKAEERDQALLGLKNQKFDGYIDWSGKLRELVKNPQMHLYLNNTNLELYYFLQFQDTPEGRKLQEIANKKLDKAISSKELDKFYQDHQMFWENSKEPRYAIPKLSP